MLQTILSVNTNMYYIMFYISQLLYKSSIIFTIIIIINNLINSKYNDENFDAIINTNTDKQAPVLLINPVVVDIIMLILAIITVYAWIDYYISNKVSSSRTNINNILCLDFKHRITPSYII
jgi:hypothetical protein